MIPYERDYLPCVCSACGHDTSESGCNFMMNKDLVIVCCDMCGENTGVKPILTVSEQCQSHE